MTSRPRLSGLLIAFVPLLAGCTANNQVGAPGQPGQGGAAKANVAGITIEARPQGPDGGNVSVSSDEDGVHHVAISGIQVVLKRRDNVSLDVTIDGEECGSVKEGDHLRIDEHRNVFVNDQPITSRIPNAEERNDNEPRRSR